MQDAIGVDISKDTLDAFHEGAGDYRQFANSAAGLRAFCRWASGCDRAAIVFEASGAYHRDLERALSRQGLAYSKVNPRQARRFAEAIGRVAKTDKVDSRVLARMGAALQLAPTVALPEHVADLQELLVFRRALIKDRTAARTRLKTVRQPLLRRLLNQRLAQIERQMTAVDSAMQDIIAADPELRERLEILVSIPGISTISATAVLANMPELGQMTGKQTAALAGLAPPPGRFASQIACRAANVASVGTMAGTGAYSRRTQLCSSVPLHARSQRDPAQPLGQDEIRTARPGRKAAKGRSYCRHAQADRLGQRASERS